MSTAPANYPPYTPITSLGRELGIMFAFIGACVVTMVIYSFAWRAHQTRTKAQDLARRKAFQNRASITNPHYLAARAAVSSIAPASGRIDGGGSGCGYTERVGLGLGMSEKGLRRGAGVGIENGSAGLEVLPVYGYDGYRVGVELGGRERRDLL